MPPTFVSEPLAPLGDSFDADSMAQGLPGVPKVFRWRNREFHVVAVLEQWKECGDCTHGSGERYVRKHGFRVKTLEGQIMVLFFQRHFGRGKKTAARWWVYTVESESPAG